MCFKLYISICYHFNMFLGLRKCQHSGVATSSGPSPHQGYGLAFKGCRMQRRVRRNQGEALAEGDPQGMVTACDSFVIMFHPSNDHPTHSLTQRGSHQLSGGLCNNFGPKSHMEKPLQALAALSIIQMAIPTGGISSDFYC